MTSVLFQPARAVCTPTVLALALAALVSCSAFAQTDSSIVPVLVTASRNAQPAAEVLTDYVVISADEIARSGQTTLLEMLQQKRGIEVVRNGGPGTASSVFMRGAANSQNVVLIDGVRVGSATLGGATWHAMPLSQIDRVEIVYGPLSTLYGADAVGGVVQIFTKQGNGAPQFTGAAGVGSYGLRTLESGISGSTLGEHRFSYALGAALEDANGFSATLPGNFSYNPDRDGYRKGSASAQFSLELARGQEIGLKFLHSRLDAQVDLGAAPYDARGVSEVGSTAVYSKNQITPTWQSLVQFTQGIDKSDSLASTGISTANTRQNGLSWQNDLNLGGDLLQLLVERREEQVESTTAAVGGKRATNAAAVTYQLRRGAHLASAGLRQDNSSQFGDHTSGSLGYGYQLSQVLRASASLGTSFRAPTFNELYFPNFGVPTNKPEQGKNIEAGLYYNDGKNQLSGAYYHNRITDLLVTAVPCPTTPTVAGSSCAYNVDRALLEGYTLAGATRLGEFSLHGSLDLQDPRDETTGKSLNRRARKHGSLGLDYAHGSYHLGSELLFSGARFDDLANKNKMGGFGVLNVFGSVDFAPDWSAVARWNNVTDKNYQLARNFATPGSNLFLGVRYGFR